MTRDPGVICGLTRRISHCRWRWFKNAFIRIFVRLFAVDVDEAVSPDPGDYEHFDAFFTRALKPGARVLPQQPDALICPCDGTVSQAGRISGGRIVQAKGKTFTATQLLADTHAASEFENGSFITLYLAPRDYHRVHMPITGHLRQEIHVPGRLFSVSERSARTVPDLFARNERLVMHFDTGEGELAIVMVAAILVSGIETRWRSGVYPTPRQPQKLTLETPVTLERGEELGRFHWGSTVILLRPEASPPWRPELKPGAQVQMGHPLTQT